MRVTPKVTENREKENLFKILVAPAMNDPMTKSILKASRVPFCVLATFLDLRSISEANKSR